MQKDKSQEQKKEQIIEQNSMQLDRICRSLSASSQSSVLKQSDLYSHLREGQSINSRERTQNIPQKNEQDNAKQQSIEVIYLQDSANQINNKNDYQVIIPQPQNSVQNSQYINSNNDSQTVNHKSQSFSSFAIKHQEEQKQHKKKEDQVQKNKTIIPKQINNDGPNQQEGSPSGQFLGNIEHLQNNPIESHQIIIQAQFASGDESNSENSPSWSISSIESNKLMKSLSTAGSHCQAVQSSGQPFDSALLLSQPHEHKLMYNVSQQGLTQAMSSASSFDLKTFQSRLYGRNDVKKIRVKIVVTISPRHLPFIKTKDHLLEPGTPFIQSKSYCCSEQFLKNVMENQKLLALERSLMDMVNNIPKKFPQPPQVQYEPIKSIPNTLLYQFQSLSYWEEVYQQIKSEINQKFLTSSIMAQDQSMSVWSQSTIFSIGSDKFQENKSTTLQISKQQSLVSCIMCTQDDKFVFISRKNRTSRTETLVLLDNDHKTVLLQRKYDQVYQFGMFVMLQAHVVIYPNVSSHKIDFINLHSHETVQLHHQYLFDGEYATLYMNTNIQAFADSNVFVIQQESPIQDHVKIQKRRLTYYGFNKYQNKYECAHQLYIMDDINDQFTSFTKSAKGNQDSMIIFWSNPNPKVQEKPFVFAYFDLFNMTGGPNKVIIKDHCLKTFSGKSKTNIEAIWQVKPNLYMMVTTLKRKDLKVFMIDTSQGNEQATIRKSWITFQPKAILKKCNRLRKISFFYIQKAKQGGLVDVNVYYVNNETETIMKTQTLTQIDSSIDLFFPTYESSKMIEVSKSVHDEENLKVNVKTFTDQSEISFCLCLPDQLHIENEQPEG